MTEALTKVDEKVGNFNQQVQLLNQSQEGITKILAGVKKYGTLAEFSLDALIKDLLPASQFMTNVKMKEDTSENVEFAIKLQGDVLVPVDSHFPVEKFKAITDGHDAQDKRAVADARAKLATAFKAKAKSVNEKYIVPPKTTDFAIVYAPTESLYKELTEYQDPSTKELLTQELMKKHKIVICGPNTLSAYLQSLHMGFQSLKVQKGATEIYNHLKTITSRFGKHFDNIISLRKKLEEAMSVVDKFGTDARAKLATAFKAKAKSDNEKYIVPPKTTDFAIVYAPTESLYKELTEYQDPSTKELLTQELMKKHKVVICGPNTLSAYLQSLHMGFQSLKVQKGATEIYNHLKTITSRFGKHFDNIISLRKKLEEAMSVVDKFGTDARSITRTLESIKDPEQLEKAVQTENVEKFVDRSKQANN